MKSDRPAPVAIVGGGFSGTILAAHLARRGIDSVLIDGSGRVGKGVAYSTKEPAHLLNVRAEGMSAWADEPNHFAQHFEAKGGDRRGFAERRLFADYIGEILDGAVASGHAQIDHGSVVSATRDDGHWSVGFADGRSVQAGALVLAIGNQEPDRLHKFEAAGERFINNPWAADARSAIEDLVENDGDALIVGTGLTMIDLVLSLDAAGFRGSIVALSRRGQIPRSHADFEPAPVEESDLPAGDLIGLWRWLRHRAAKVGWRAAVDSLRPHSHSLWQSFDEDRQRRFLRHARAWWDVHRHRIAPDVARAIANMVADGRLQIMAARIQKVRPVDGGLEIDVRKRGAPDARAMRFAYAFNCTGPLHSIEHTRDPLLRSLLDAGEVAPDRLGMGLAVDENSRAGERNIWALGPLTKGRYWEIIAVPDIRVQAAAVAEDIARELEA
ncbi:MAG TPA: FAD/NAD(P)-binding protein [Sphingomicrobium sp.]|jgi:uncharacterized NAD(P)/FAD-binding protein YdhS|nr:FAD/NAD(P)-binding protein [Sphingomicrobium sp.]